MSTPPIQVTHHQSTEDLPRTDSSSSTALDSSSLTLTSPIHLQVPSSSPSFNSADAQADWDAGSPTPTSHQPRKPLSLNTTALAAVEALSSPKSPKEDSPIRSPLIRSPPSASKAKFQDAVRRTIHIQNVSNKYVWKNQNEPGIDVRRMDFPHLQEDITIEVADYDLERIRDFRFGNKEFIDFLEKPRPSWAKVRWINVNGMSWDVLRAVALKYDLHPLAIEDTMHAGSSTRPKTEFYENHLFVNLMLHSVIPNDPDESPNRNKGFWGRRKGIDEEHLAGVVDPEVNAYLANTDPSKGGKPQGLENVFVVGKEDINKEMKGMKEMFQGVHPDDTKTKSLLHVNTFSRRKSEVAKKTIKSLTDEYKVHIGSAQLSIFLLREGTLISFFHGAGPHVSNLFNRLRESQSLLRLTQDPSMLVHNLLDVVSDQALEIVEEFRKRITMLEGQVLVKPEASTVRHLHVLCAELLLLKRTLSPLATVVRRLREHRTHDEVAFPGRNTLLHRRLTDNSINDSRTELSDIKRGREPIISRTAEVYLADVADHVDSVLSSIELFTALASNLVDFTFNMISYYSNTSMMTLTVVTVVFLPLSFWAGYFGMNFTKFPGVLGPDDSSAFFWIIAIPFSIVFVLMFNYSWVTAKLGILRRKLLRFSYSRRYKSE